MADTLVDNNAVDPRDTTGYLLRRVFVPIEKKTSNGVTVFRTTDKEVYVRLADGSIRRTRSKVNGKAVRKERARAHPR